MVAPPPIDVECEAFSGSLAVLYGVARAHKINLLDIPMRPICEAYFKYLLTIGDQDLDSAAAALVALSYLVEQKSFMIIPSIDTEDDYAPDIDFAEPYISEFSAAIQALTIYEEQRDQIFFRGGQVGDLYEIPFSLGQVTSGDLSLAFERLLRKAEPDPPEILNKPRRSLTSQMELVFDILAEDYQSLIDLMPHPFTRSEAVWWFLALLELIRLGRAQLRLGDDDVLFARGECL